LPASNLTGMPSIKSQLSNLFLVLSIVFVISDKAYSHLTKAVVNIRGQEEIPVMSAVIVSSGDFIRTYDPSFKPSERLIAGAENLS